MFLFGLPGGAVVVGGVALCVTTACVGDAAVLAAIGGGAVTIGTVSGYVGLGADALATGVDCYEAADGLCAADAGGVGLDAATLGFKVFTATVRSCRASYAR